MRLPRDEATGMQHRALRDSTHDVEPVS
jgi:hypothetical protein